jgi:hypothetical protein
MTVNSPREYENSVHRVTKLVKCLAVSSENTKQDLVSAPKMRRKPAFLDQKSNKCHSLFGETTKYVIIV